MLTFSYITSLASYIVENSYLTGTANKRDWRNHYIREMYRECSTDQGAMEYAKRKVLPGKVTVKRVAIKSEYDWMDRAIRENKTLEQCQAHTLHKKSTYRAKWRDNRKEQATPTLTIHKR